MLNNWKIVLSIALVFAGNTTAPARDGGMPTIDIQKGCRAAAGELTALFGETSDSFKTCMDDEKTTHDQLVKDWGAFTAPEKGVCVRPTEYLPSYVEWQTCLEMTRDVVKLRKAASQGAGKGGQPTTSRLCPVVKMDDAGNIISVLAC